MEKAIEMDTEIVMEMETEIDIDVDTDNYVAAANVATATSPSSAAVAPFKRGRLSGASCPSGDGGLKPQSHGGAQLAS